MVQTTLSALFRSTITGVVVRGFRSSFVPVTHEGYLVESRRPLWFGSSQAIALSFIGMSLGEPHTSESNGGIFKSYILYLSYVVL